MRTRTRSQKPSWRTSSDPVFWRRLALPLRWRCVTVRRQPYQAAIQISSVVAPSKAFQFKNAVLFRRLHLPEAEQWCSKGGDEITSLNGEAAWYSRYFGSATFSPTGNFNFDEFFWVSRAFAAPRKGGWRYGNPRRTAAQPALLHAIQPGTQREAVRLPGTATAGTEKGHVQTPADFSVGLENASTTGLFCPDRTRVRQTTSRWEMWLVTAGNTD